MKKEMLCLSLIFIGLISIQLISVASASADVGYILNSPRNADKEVTDVFNDMGLSFELIKDSQVNSKNLSQYRMLFIGDERLQKTRKVQVFNFPSVIMNKYYGFEWGLTDFDGISQLASNAPLEYRLGDDVEQAYIKARFNGVSIPYYYLDDENKANFTSVARTFIGDGERFDFGDVVATAQPGTHLINGKTSKGKMCFFGISKTEFWTDDARELFKDCIGEVLIVCKKNSDCDDNNPRTEDKCINPGTVHSECKNENITCFNDAECGTDNFFGNAFCDGSSGNDVFRNFQDFTCINKGKSSSFCKNESSAVLIQKCTFGCFGGACLNDNIAPVIKLISPEDNFKTLNPNINFIYNVSDDSLIANCSLIIDGSIVSTSNSVLRGVNSFSRTLAIGEHEWKISCFDAFGNKGESEKREIEIEHIECNEDIDCGKDDFIGNKFCMNDNLFRDKISFKCINPGETSSFCMNVTTSKKTQDCGDDGFVGEKFCIGDDVFRNFKSFNCVNLGVPNAQCSSDTMPKIIQSCPDTCQNGQCVEIECFEDENCGTDVFIGDKFCFGNDLFKNFKEFKCRNKATPSSFCESEIKKKLIEDCSDSCENNKCVIIPCRKDADCGTDGFIGDKFCKEDDVFKKFKKFECENEGTSLSFCKSEIEDKKIIENCPNGCENGKCIILCSKDEDCGIDGFVGNPFCIGDDVFKFFKSFTCQNAGTPSSFCSNIEQEKILQSCVFTCNGGICVDCIPGATRACGTSSIGECKLGMQTCTSSGVFGACVGNIEPKEEVCDGKDNDCDGAVDDNCRKPQCADKLDNDKDGKYDYPADSGCIDYFDDSE